MSEMVERVARVEYERACARVRANYPEARLITWDFLPEDDREMRMGDARAAIEAMRDPTDAMIGADMDLGGYDGLYEADPSEIWRAMIDEALK